MCWETAQNRYNYGISAIYRYTTYLVPGGFGLWIIFLALVVAVVVVVVAVAVAIAVVCCWLCFLLATSTDLYHTQPPYNVSAMTPIA